MEWLWIDIGHIDAGVNAVAQRLSAIEHTFVEDINAELQWMIKDASHLDSFLEQEQCGPDECCFSISKGKHKPHCGPCVKTPEHKVNWMRFWAHHLRKAVQEDDENNESACERWRECVMKLQRRSRLRMGTKYIKDRQRCEDELVNILNTGYHRNMKLGHNCCLCVLEREYKLPSAQPVQMRPFKIQSEYSQTFYEHLRRDH